jgi:hypothetical protein
MGNCVVLGRSEVEGPYSVAVVVNCNSVQEVEGKVGDQTKEGAVLVNCTVLRWSRVVGPTLGRCRGELRLRAGGRR